MKNIWKRGLPLLFALILLMSLTVPALAEETAEESPAPETEPAQIPAPEETAAPEEAEAPVKQLGGGEESQDQAPADYREIYVSRDGSDEAGDGSAAAPFATLARAAKAANETPELPALILLLTDLEMKESARFTGLDVTIQAAEGQVVVTRAGGFAAAKDSKGRLYNPAMIELLAPEGKNQPAGSLTLLNVILDDAGRHEGSKFPETAATQPIPESETPAEAEASLTEEPETVAPSEAEAPAKTGAEAPEIPAEAQETSAEEQPAEKKTDLVQDAIVSVGDGGSLTLSTGSELRNFGGQSAVHLGEKSKLTLEPTSAIRDTKKAGNTLPALLMPESAKVERFDGAKLVERAAQNDQTLEPEDILPVSDGEENGFSSISFTADPETITRLTDSSWLQYPVSYSLDFTVSERVKALVEGAQSLINDCEGTVTLKLDGRLTPDLSSCAFTSSVFELDGEPAYDADTHTLTAKCKLKEDWASHLEELTEPMGFTVNTSLSFADFSPSTAEKDEYLESTAKVSLSLMTDSRVLGPYDSSEKTAKTKMLGLGNATLVYDPNGGTGGPDREIGVSPQKEYPLKTEPKPTHEAVAGTSVVFLGWSETKDEKIYARGEEKPATVNTVAIPSIEELTDLLDNTVTVYAVYGYDSNEDGIADVDQLLATLSFDPNGGQNAPDPIIHVVGSAESGELGVDIPEQEPNRDYYTFVGWGETADAKPGDKLYKHDAEKADRRDIPVTKDTTLYAVWQENYKIQYDANGGQNAPAATVLKTQTKSGTDAKGNATYTGRAAITTGVPTRAGYSFQGWSTSRRGAAAYFAGDEVEISGGNVTLYAVWTRNGSGSTTGGGSGSGSGSSGAPKTGDNDMTAYLALLGGSVLGIGAIGAVIWTRRKHKKEETEE